MEKIDKANWVFRKVQTKQALGCMSNSIFLLGLSDFLHGFYVQDKLS